ncbi:MAG: transposase [Bacteroidota bacterium]
MQIVKQVIDQIDLAPLVVKYEEGGISSYHPRMLFKVVVFSFLSNIFSSRWMEAALKKNIHYVDQRYEIARSV